MNQRQLSFDVPSLNDAGSLDPNLPEGLVYEPDFVTLEEEQNLIAFIDTLDLEPVTMRGQPSRRTVRHFGFAYAYESWEIATGDPIPAELRWVRDRCAGLAEVEPKQFAQLLVSRYPEGAGIGWHRDAPKFGPKVAGVSLGSACRMRFQRGAGTDREVFALELEPRSAYILGGAARSSWQHSIPAAKALRYSLTFRMVKREEPVSGGQRGDR